MNGLDEMKLDEVVRFVLDSLRVAAASGCYDERPAEEVRRTLIRIIGNS